jgi:hypothetical protein
MTDDEVEVFLSMKFGMNNATEVVNKFKTAFDIHGREGAASDETVQAAVRLWAEHGAPEKFEVTETTAPFMLKLKFGSLKKAYAYWVNLPRNTHSGLSEHELKLIIDYVDKPK